MLWVLIIVLMGFCVVPFIWWAGSEVFNPMRTGGIALMQQLGTNSTLTDNVDSFLVNADKYILALFLLGLALFAFVYSQKKGELVYEG